MIKAGVFGAGHLGKIHIRCLKNVEKVEIIGFYDQNEEVRKEVSATFGIPYFEDADSLIAQSDAIDIVTPTVSHHEVAMKALKEKKHVFIEKPITAT
ncbi:MAG: Gfo/Idh/MocA family oxidoreductase, partial [Bacteroidales bacterium]|nr:Gfo/Idh/MocA family oxidoreductase [Bacteroidales bacterium]